MPLFPRSRRHNWITLSSCDAGTLTSRHPAGSPEGKSVAVIGGGISGLALAWDLRRRGIGCTVFEASERSGGKIQTESMGGFLVERGPVGLTAADPDVRMMIDALGLGRRLVPATGARRRGVLAAGASVQQVPQSLPALLASRLLSPWEKLRALSDLLRRPQPPRRPADETLASFGRRHLGSGGAAKLLFPSLPGAYALDPAHTSVASAFPWLSHVEASEGSVLRAAPELLRRADSGLAAFAGGMEELPRALAAALGPDLQLATALRGIVPHGRGYRLHLEQQGADHEMDVSAVVFAVPAHAGARVLGAFDSGLSEALAGIPYVPVTLASFGFATSLPSRLEGHGFYVPPGRNSVLAGAVFSSSMFPGRAPAGHALVTARVGGARHPELAELSDDELLQLTWSEISELAGIRGPPRDARIVRHAQALPQYRVGHRERVSAIDAGEQRHPGLFFTGNAYRGASVADCVRDSLRVAERVARVMH
jgi:protoporphyrinogen/coproporphyrinogen III oxidase